MKKLSILLIIVFIASGCATEEEKTYSTIVGTFTPYVVFPEILQGQVKSIVEKNYYAKEEDGKLVKADLITIAARDTFSWTNDFKVMFNEEGIVLKSETLDENDEVISLEEIIVVDGKIVQSNAFKNDTLILQGFFMNDENGHVKKIKRMRMPEDTLINNIEMKCDSTGMLMAFRFISANGEKGYSYKLLFDDNGVNTGYVVKNPEGEQTVECVLLRNEKGFMTQQTFINKNGERVTNLTYEEYDHMGNWTSAVGTDENGVIIIEERIITYFEE